MNRFHKERKKHSLAGRLFVPLLSFAAVMLFLWVGIRDASDAASAEQEKSLKNAIQRSVVHCYAVEGSYPPSLEYLKDHYGLTYDGDRYLVDYRIFGSNLMPDITVIPLQ